MSVQYQARGRSASEIAASVEAGIAGGQLSPGDTLASVRTLATSLGVSPATVSAAYQQLRTRGVVVSLPRRGVRVAPRPPVALRAGGGLPKGVRDLATGSPDPALLPHPRPAVLRPLLYGEEPVLALLADLARDQLRADGVPAEGIGVVGGAMDGIERVLGAHLRVGDRVAVEDPGYTGVLDLVRAMGLEPIGVPLDERGLRPGRLAPVLDVGVAALVLTPRAQNPTGAAMDASRAAELSAALDAHPGVLVIEDDHAGPVAGAAYHTVTAARFRWAVTRSVSKSLGPDLRLAVLAADPVTLARVEGRQRLGTGWVSWVLQRLVADLWTDNEVTRQLTHATEVYARRRAALIAALAARGIAATGRSGLNVWVPVPEEGPVISGLLGAGWSVRPGEPYRLATPPAVRICTAALHEEDAAQLAADLAALYSPPARTHPA
ncbi:MAG: aminotransferase class I/II-fold pyridoxal phosphate-dependent enzyme [Egibacteraceae bacterium]